jgi:hypothetical protein
VLGSLVGWNLSLFTLALVELILSLFIVIRKVVLILTFAALSIFVVLIRYETIFIVFSFFTVVILVTRHD